MTSPTCHVYCTQRGERFCGPELSAVKDMANAASSASAAAVAGDYATAERDLTEALRALGDAAVSRDAARISRG